MLSSISLRPLNRTLPCGIDCKIPRHFQLPFFSSSSSSSRCSFASVAVVRRVSPLLADGLCMDKEDNKQLVCYEDAVAQHHEYVETLRSIVPRVIEAPPLPDHPDGVFVEDTLVVRGHTAVLTNPGHISRKTEVESVKTLLEQLKQQGQLGSIQIVEQQEKDDTTPNAAPNGTCDGGDVLQVGKYVFVGLSKRTNYEGYQFLSSAFQDNQSDGDDGGVEVLPIQLPETQQALHLKSIVTNLDDNTLLAPVGQVGDSILQQLQSHHPSFEAIRLPSLLACNVVSVNGHVLAQDGGSAESRSILTTVCKEKQLQLHWMDASEFAKVDGALTCCSVLME